MPAGESRPLDAFDNAEYQREFIDHLDRKLRAHPRPSLLRDVIRTMRDADMPDADIAFFVKDMIVRIMDKEYQGLMLATSPELRHIRGDRTHNQRIEAFLQEHFADLPPGPRMSRRAAMRIGGAAVGAAVGGSAELLIGLLKEKREGPAL